MKRKLLGQTDKRKIDEIVNSLVEKHLSGSGFYEELQTELGSALNLHSSLVPSFGSDVNTVDGGAYGLYVKKRKVKGHGLNPREIGSSLDRSKKAGRPLNPDKKRRAFDPNSKTARRGAKVKEIMKSKNLDFISASQYIAKNKIPY